MPFTIRLNSPYTETERVRLEVLLEESKSVFVPFLENVAVEEGASEVEVACEDGAKVVVRVVRDQVMLEKSEGVLVPCPPHIPVAADTTEVEVENDDGPHTFRVVREEELLAHRMFTVTGEALRLSLRRSRPVVSYEEQFLDTEDFRRLFTTTSGAVHDAELHVALEAELSDHASDASDTDPDYDNDDYESEDESEDEASVVDEDSDADSVASNASKDDSIVIDMSKPETEPYEVSTDGSDFDSMEDPDGGESDATFNDN